MKPINKQNNLTTEQELTKRLMITVASLIAVTTVIFLSLTVFAPTFASLFKIFSSRSDTEQLVIKPNKPVFTIEKNFVNTDSIELKGYAQQGNTVNLFVNGPQVESTIVGSDGLFVFNSVSLINGRNTLFARVVDQRGTESNVSETIVITLDKNAPELEIESPKKDDVIRNLDNRITIKGKVNEKSSIVINDQVAILKPDLTFEHLLGVESGEVDVVVIAKDEAGNETKQEIKVTYQKSSR